MRVLEGQPLAVEVYLGLRLKLALVVEERVVRVDHDLALLGVQLVGETELHLHGVGLQEWLGDHYIIW